MSTPKAATRKSRTARRARRTAGDSDDEVERLAHSSDSDHSIPNSDTSDSEIISSSDDELDTPAAPATATDHSVSPPSRRTNRKGNGAGRKPATSTSDEPSIVAPSLIPNPTTDWSDLAAQDDGIPTSDPPIVDFGDFVSKGIESIADAGPSQTGRDDIAGPDADEPTPDPAQSGGRGRPKGRGGKTQRQAYLERLSEDPSFTPRVGAFWGHDERLLAPELRGMSEWWRGRWNGRGRGTNARARGRGREGWTNRTERGVDAGATEEGSQSLAPQPASSPPPIDRTWGHDGFEKMREHEHPRPLRGGLRGRGRGQARGRGRGGQIGIAREPEQLWTKAPDTHLHIDNSMRPQFPGQGRGIKINLPGRWRSTIVRVAPTTSTPSFPTAPKTTGLDATEIVVKLPGQQAKVVPVATIPQNKPALPEDPVTVLPLQEAPRSVVARLPGAPGNLSQTSTAGSASLQAASAPKAPNMSIPRPISALPAQVLDQQPASTQSGASPKSTLRAPVHGRTRSQLDAVAFAQTAVPISESTPLAFGSLPTLASVTAPPTKHGHIHAQAPAEMAQAPTDIPALAITVPAPVTQALPQPHGVAPYTPPPASAYTPHNPYAYAYTPLDGAAYYSTATPPPPPHQPHMYYPSNTYFVPPRPSGPVSIRAPGESVDENASRAAPAPPMWNYYAHNHYYSPSGTPYPPPPPPRGYYAPPTHGGEYPNSQPSEYTGMYDGYVPGAVYY